MIRVKGVVTLRSNFDVELDMTEEEFDNLAEWEQNDEIEAQIDWHDWTAGAETTEVDVWDLDEIGEEEE